MDRSPRPRRKILTLNNKCSNAEVLAILRLNVVQLNSLDEETRTVVKTSTSPVDTPKISKSPTELKPSTSNPVRRILDKSFTNDTVTMNLRPLTPPNMAVQVTLRRSERLQKLRRSPRLELLRQTSSLATLRRTCTSESSARNLDPVEKSTKPSKITTSKFPKLPRISSQVTQTKSKKTFGSKLCESGHIVIVWRKLKERQAMISNGVRLFPVRYPNKSIYTEDSGLVY